jgi:hypothetical protein
LISSCGVRCTACAGGTGCANGFALAGALGAGALKGFIGAAAGGAGEVDDLRMSVSVCVDTSTACEYIADDTTTSAPYVEAPGGACAAATAICHARSGLSLANCDTDTQ